MENLQVKNNFSDEAILSLVSNVHIKPTKPKTLTSCTQALTKTVSDLWCGFGNFAFNTELCEKKVRQIAQKLALAIDENSVERVKLLKQEYGKNDEFVQAKKFLNEKCKQVWNVFEPYNNIPYEAMKALGITNQPTLDDLLGNSVRFFEKDNGKTTANIINSILNNPRINYTIEDIHRYLADMNFKENCKYNKETIKYLIVKQNYDDMKLEELGVNKTEFNSVLKILPFKYKAKNFAQNLCLCFN
ncbi:hypothetical protein IJ579_03120 [bacterium]|nr:hypothetical protein [bacterium]